MASGQFLLINVRGPLALSQEDLGLRERRRGFDFTSLEIMSAQAIRKKICKDRSRQVVAARAHVLQTVSFADRCHEHPQCPNGPLCATALKLK